MPAVRAEVWALGAALLWVGFGLTVAVFDAGAGLPEGAGVCPPAGVAAWAAIWLTCCCINCHQACAS